MLSRYAASHTPAALSLRQLSSGTPRRSPHAQWYSQILPSMLPIAILGSSVYLALHLVQTHLARERYADHAKARIEALESELLTLRHQNVSDTMTEDPPPRFRRWWFF